MYASHMGTSGGIDGAPRPHQKFLESEDKCERAQPGFAIHLQIPQTASMDEDTIDEILYLARANEVDELSSYLSDVSIQAKQSKAELVAAAADPYSKNTALHYAAANGHVGMSNLVVCFEPFGELDADCRLQTR